MTLTLPQWFADALQGDMAYDGDEPAPSLSGPQFRGSATSAAVKLPKTGVQCPVLAGCRPQPGGYTPPAQPREVLNRVPHEPGGADMSQSRMSALVLQPGFTGVSLRSPAPVRAFGALLVSSSPG